jgi:hypothetical protein
MINLFGFTSEGGRVHWKPGIVIAGFYNNLKFEVTSDRPMHPSRFQFESFQGLARTGPQQASCDPAKPTLADRWPIW